MPWHLEILGSASGTFSTGHNGIQWIVCWCRHRHAIIWHPGGAHKLAGAILFLFDTWTDVVRVLALASLRKATGASNDHSRRNEIHRKIARRIIATYDANIFNHTVGRYHPFETSLCNCRGKFLSFVEFLHARTVSKCVSEESVRF